jgi:hypothetical protein
MWQHRAVHSSQQVSVVFYAGGPRCSEGNRVNVVPTWPVRSICVSHVQELCVYRLEYFPVLSYRILSFWNTLSSVLAFFTPMYCFVKLRKPEDRDASS